MFGGNPESSPGYKDQNREMPAFKFDAGFEAEPALSDRTQRARNNFEKLHNSVLEA